MSPDRTPVWFITGCSSGLGRELACHGLERGRHVVVTARDLGKIGDLVEGRRDQALALKLDVTKPAEIEAAVKLAEKQFGYISVLVNNAGLGYVAAIEEGEDAKIRDLFETNVFGLFTLTRAVLPGMRAQRNGAIINLSSIGGLMGFPSSGYYCATKFAVEGFSDALAQEVAPLGIKVMIVEPGGFRTRGARSVMRSSSIIKDYDATSGKFRRRFEWAHGRQPGDPVRAAGTIFDVIESDAPPLHLVLGKSAVDLSRVKARAFLDELATWETTSVTADFA